MVKTKKIETLSADQIGGLQKDPQNTAVELQEAEKIVNDYGRAMMAVSKRQRSQVKSFLKQPTGFKDYDFFTINAKEEDLPYPKHRIKSALELLLNHDEDPKNRALLKAGLQYLEYFV